MAKGSLNGESEGCTACKRTAKG